MMDTTEISQYQRILMEIKEAEKKLQDFFILMARNQSIQYDRCSDYGERGVSLFIPFDALNGEAFALDKIEELKRNLSSYKLLRDKQRKLELKVDSLRSINRINAGNTSGGL